MQTVLNRKSNPLSSGIERRKHARLSYVWPVRFCELTGNPPKLLHFGKCKNLSQGGIKISALTPLERSAIALLDLDLNALSLRIRTDEIILVSDKHILVEVAWRHLNLQTGLFEAGLRFLEARKIRKYASFIERATSIEPK